MNTADWLDFGFLAIWMAPAIMLAGRFGYELWQRGKTDTSTEVPAQWGLYRPITIIIAGYYLLGYIAVPVIFSFLFGLFFQDAAVDIQAWFDKSYVGFSYSLMVTACELALIWWFMQRRGGSFRTLGLQRFKARFIANAALTFVLYFITYVAVAYLIISYIPEIDTNQEQILGFQSIAGYEYILVYLALVVIPAFGEEILMRGFLYRALKKRLPHLWAMVITSALFAAAHLQLGSGAPPLWIAAVDTFILSIALIKLTEYSKSLWPAILVHMIKNSLAFVQLFVIKK